MRDDEVPGWSRGLGQTGLVDIHGHAVCWGNGARLLRLEPPAATWSKITWTL